MYIKKIPLAHARGIIMPAAGLEPARCCHQQILSLPRLPIPTSRRPQTSILNLVCVFNMIWDYFSQKIIYFNSPSTMPKLSKVAR